MKKKSNIVKFAKRIDFNVGYLVFIVIVLYIIASVIMYATSKKTTIYQVSDGSLSVNNVYTGFVMRDEDVIKSDYAGTINYYSNDCDKADKVSVIYSIDETGHIAELLEKYSDKVLNEDDLKSIKSMLSEYTSFYSNNTFGNIYSTKKSVISKLNRSHYNVIVNDLDNIISQAGNTTLFHKEKAIKTGIVMFNIDGYEDFKESPINPDVFDMSNYNIRNLKDNNIEPGKVLNVKDVRNALTDMTTEEYMKGAVSFADNEESEEYSDANFLINRQSYSKMWCPVSTKNSLVVFIKT